MEHRPEAWVAGLVAAHAGGERFVPQTDPPATAHAAYRIQAGVVQHVGAVGGFKTARKQGAPSIMAPIFARDIVASGAQVAVRDLLGIELEVGFEIRQDCPADRVPVSPEALRALLRPVVVIELVDTRVQGAAAGDDMVMLADHQINAGLVVGASVAEWAGPDFGTLEARLRAGEDVVMEGAATVPGGSALESFADGLIVSSLWVPSPKE